MFLFPKKIKNSLVTYVNLTEVTSLKRGFHVSSDAAPKNTEKEKCNERLHTFKTSLGSLNINRYQAFTNYNFSCTVFRARKTVLRARRCTWEIVHVKE